MIGQNPVFVFLVLSTAVSKRVRINVQWLVGSA